MAYSSEKKRVSFFLAAELLDKMDQNCKKANCRSRNEFAIEAILFYIGYLNCEDDAKYLVRSIDQSIAASVGSLEERTSRLLFKLAVEMSMMMNLLAANLEFDENILGKLRAKCIQDLKASAGNLSMEKIVKNLNK